MLKGEKLGEAIRSAMKKKGVSPTELARHFGVKPPSIHDWMRTGRISKDKLEKLFKYFSDVVGPDHFGWELSDGPIAPEDRGIEPGPDIKGFVPLISWVQAGNWAAIEPAHDADIAETWLPCPVAHGRRTFILRVSGPSMEPEYQDGCWIFVDPDKEATSGSDIVVRLDDQNEATFKRLIIDRDKKYLQALNPAWPDRIIQVDENATIVGVVIFSGQPR